MTSYLYIAILIVIHIKLSTDAPAIKVEGIPKAPAQKCDKGPSRVGCFSLIHFLVISIKPKYVAPVAKDPVTPAAMPRYKPAKK